MKDIDLMAHADGELDDREVAELEKRLASDPAARTKAEALGEMTDLVRGRLELAADDVPTARFDAMWRAIDDATAPAPAKEPVKEPGLWAAFAAWFEKYRGYVFTSAATAGVVAVLAMVLRDPVATKVIHRGSAIDVQPAALRQAPEIESLDVPDGEGTVLNLEDEDGHTTVIWVSPADTVEGI